VLIRISLAFLKQNQKRVKRIITLLAYHTKLHLKQHVANSNPKSFGSLSSSATASLSNTNNRALPSRPPLSPWHFSPITMKNKQTDIAVFFGGKPKHVSTKASPEGKKAQPATANKPSPSSEEKKKRKDEQQQVEQQEQKQEDKSTSPIQNKTEGADDKKPRKRLRKAGEEATTTVTQDGGTGASGSSPPPTLTEEAKAVKETAVVAIQEEDQEIAEEKEYVLESSESSERESDSINDEEEEEVVGKKKKKAGKAAEGAAPTTAKGKKKSSKSPLGKSKLEGVGTGAIKAAAEHGNFDLSQLATWPEGKPVPFGFLADTFEAIAEESKRLVITNLLINAFRTVIATSPNDLVPMVYLCTNRVAPAHSGLELGIGDSTLIKALAQATGRKESAIKKEYDEEGDLGVVAAASRATQKTMFQPAPLTISGVFQAFKDIASTEGKSSQDRKQKLIIKLLVAAGQNEAGYVMRALQGKLRIGLAEQTVLVALAHALLLQKEKLSGSGEAMAGALEEGARIVKAVYSECPSYDELISAALSAPVADLPLKVHFKPGVPIKPMLAKPTNGVGEVLDKFSNQEFTCEYKYDGERAQIHVCEDGTVKIYSRNSEDNTGKYPDIAALLPKVLKPGVKSVVLDAEAVAYDRETGRILPFQVLSTRARKDVTVDNIKVQVCIFAFDCLYMEGRVLLREPLTVRRDALKAALTEIPGQMEFAVAKTSHDIEELTKFLDDSVEAGTEGLIVKTMADSYEPSKRSSHWLKLKKDYLNGVGDTFDLVPIGAWFGKGKRTGVYGSYLLAVYDPENEEYQTICKIGTGFSEEQLKQLAELMTNHAINHPRSYYRYSDNPNLIPDIWFSPAAVWEVKAADLSISPAHKAANGRVDDVKGISIRFPRLMRVRDDKAPEDATSAEQVAEMYQNQAVLQNNGNGGRKTFDEDY
jgi:DNA ligase-1